MALTHERTFRVRHYECDSYGHVNHANYLRYMQEAAFDASAAAFTAVRHRSPAGMVIQLSHNGIRQPLTTETLSHGGRRFLFGPGTCPRVLSGCPPWPPTARAIIPHASHEPARCDEVQAFLT